MRKGRWTPFLCGAAPALAFAQGATFRVEGRVVDAARRPVEGARVVLRRAGPDFAPVEGAATSGAGGRFAIAAGDAQGKYEVEVVALAGAGAPAAAAGAPAAGAHVVGIPGEWGSVPLGDVAIHAPVALRGRVLDAGGRPVAGARVLARPSRRPAAPAREVVANDRGEYEILGILPGRHDLVARAPGFAEASRPGFVVAAPDPKEAELVLGVEAPLEVVVAGDGGAPVAGALVRARRRDALETIDRAPVATDAAGRARLGGLGFDWEAYVILVAEPRHVTETVPGSRFFLGNAVRLRRGVEAVVRVEPPATIARLELETSTRAGQGWRREAVVARAADAVVLAPDRWRVTFPPGDVLRAFATLEGGGQAASAHLELAKARGAAELVAAPVPAASRPAALPGPPSRVLPGSAPAASRPAAPARVAGTLRLGVGTPNEETPILAIRITTEDERKRLEPAALALAGRDGSFAFDALEAGRYALVPKRPAARSDGALRDFASEFPSIERIPWRWGVDLVGEPRVVPLELPLPQERAVEGSVYLGGAPAPGIRATLLPRGEAGAAASDTTDAQGRYRLPVFAAGDYEVRFVGSGLRETRRIAVADGQGRQVNVAWEMGSVRGALDAEGGGAAGARVMLQRAADRERAVLWQCAPVECETDAAGAFELPAVAPGRHRLVVWDPRRRFATVASEPFDLAAGEARALPALRVPREVPLRVEARERGGGRGTGRVWVLSREGAPLAQLAQSWLFAQHEAIVVHGLPPGSYRVAMPGYFDEAAALAPGTPATVRFARPRPEGEPGPAGDSPYHSREAEEEKKWDWGGAPPQLFAQEDVGGP